MAAMRQKKWYPSPFISVITAVATIVLTATSSEWKTASGQHCIDACHYSSSKNRFYWCHTANREENGRKWDYCTPTRFFELDKTSLEWVEMTNDTVQDENVLKTVLYEQTKCTGDCKVYDSEKLQAMAKYLQYKKWQYFSCGHVTNELPKREHLSSMGLWCISDCADNKCNTMMGKDAPCDTDTKGNKELAELEYAVVGTGRDSSLAICANPCDGAPYKHCAVLTWKPMPSGNGYQLVRESAPCLGSPVPLISVSSIVGIVIFALALCLICICIVYSQLRNKGD